MKAKALGFSVLFGLLSLGSLLWVAAVAVLVFAVDEGIDTKLIAMDTASTPAARRALVHEALQVNTISMSVAAVLLACLVWAWIKLARRADAWGESCTLE